MCSPMLRPWAALLAHVLAFLRCWCTQTDDSAPIMGEEIEDHESEHDTEEEDEDEGE